MTRKNPRLESLIIGVAVLLAAVVAAFVKSAISGQPFALNWGVTIVAALACAAISYLGPALLFHFGKGRRS